MQKQSEELETPKDSESSFPKTAQRSIFKEILGKSLKYEIAALVSALAYWLLYAHSSGMFQYYSFDITPYLTGDF